MDQNERAENVETYYRDWCDMHSFDLDDDLASAIKTIINNYLVCDAVIKDIRRATMVVK